MPDIQGRPRLVTQISATDEVKVKVTVTVTVEVEVEVEVQVPAWPWAYHSCAIDGVSLPAASLSQPKKRQPSSISQG